MPSASDASQFAVHIYRAVARLHLVLAYMASEYYILQDAAKRRVGALVAALRGLRTIQAAMQEFDGEHPEHAKSTSSSDTQSQLSFLASIRQPMWHNAQQTNGPHCHGCCPSSGLGSLGAAIAAK